VTIKAIAFVGSPVTNMNRAREFYEGVLGSLLDTEMTGVHWAEYPIGGGTLALASVGEHWKPSQDGTSAALEVDIWARRSRAWKSEKFSTTRSMAVVQDPDDNKIIIHKLKPENGKGICK